MHDGPNGAGLSRKAILSEIDKSLKRLGTDYVDFFFSSRRRHTRLTCDWSSDVCSSDLGLASVSRNICISRRMQIVFFGSSWMASKASRGSLQARAVPLAVSIRPLVTLQTLRPNSTSAEIGRASCRERVQIAGEAHELNT